MNRPLPETDVVLECKLDPVDDLWDLWNHRQNGHPNEVLKKNQRSSENLSLKMVCFAQMLTCEMFGWLSMGWMCSVVRSAQADVRTVAMMRMTRDRHRDQWTTVSWCSVTAQTQREMKLHSINKCPL